MGGLTSSGGGLAGVDVADNDDVDMEFLLTAQTVSLMVLIRRATTLGSASGGRGRLSVQNCILTHPMMIDLLNDEFWLKG